MKTINDIVAEILAHQQDDKRMMVAIAGPPASGKSTLADLLGKAIGQSVVVPMDGFHLDNAVLDKMGARSRKGAPHTFDGAGFVQMIAAIAKDEGTISVPEFDRTLDAVVEGDSKVTPNDRIILVEGNYLLLKDEPWAELAELFDFTIFVNPGIETLRDRLIKRWEAYDHSYDEALARATSNDIPNAELVIKQSVEPKLGLTGFAV